MEHARLDEFAEAARVIAQLVALEAELTKPRDELNAFLAMIRNARHRLEKQLADVRLMQHGSLPENVRQSITDASHALERLATAIVGQNDLQDVGAAPALPQAPPRQQKANKGNAKRVLPKKRKGGFGLAPLAMRIFRAVFTGDSWPETLEGALEYTYGPGWHDQPTRITPDRVNGGSTSTPMGDPVGLQYIRDVLRSAALLVHQSEGGTQEVNGRPVATQARNLLSAIQASDHEKQGRILLTLQGWGVEIL